MSDRYAFMVSDRTGITAENLGLSLLCHFPTVHFKTVALPFIDSREKALDAVNQINAAAERSGRTPLVFATLADDEVRATISSSRGVVFDLFDTFLAPLEKELGLASEHSVGSSHGVLDPKKYTSRISALNYTMRVDDGMNVDHYDQADVVVIGVSRTAKTPTSLYLALHFGIFAANYPLIGEDLDRGRLPDRIVRHRQKLFGLTIDPERLQQIRSERYDKGRYAQLKQCQYEVAQAEALFRRERIPYVDTTSKSVEEIAATILHRAHLKRDLL
jgi:regulator of PEP synthase PpsR (kinase-PPPase family)